MSESGFTRRAVLAGGAAAGVGLAVAFSLKSRPAKDVPKDDKEVVTKEFDSIITLRSDGSARFTLLTSELGQGALTGMAMILAEELEIPWDKVEARMPVWSTQRGPVYVEDSDSIVSAFVPLRELAAALREHFIKAGAEKLGAEVADCIARNAHVEHPKTSRKVPYGDLFETVLKVALDAPSQIKPDWELRLIGKSKPPLLVEEKVTAKLQFPIDAGPKGTLVALLAPPPTFDAKAESFDPKGALSVPGVVAVEPIETGVAVVAKSFWAAKKGLSRLEVKWSSAEGRPSAKAFFESARTKVGEGASFHSVATKTRSATKKDQSTFSTPLLAHRAAEPMAFAADVRSDGADVWLGTQAISDAFGVITPEAQLKSYQIKGHLLPVGGSFGRRLATDFVSGPSALSRQLKAPVKLIWTREHELKRGRFGPWSYHEMEGGLDADGWPVVWVHRIVTTGVRTSNMLESGQDSLAARGADIPYEIPSIEAKLLDLSPAPAPIWYWPATGYFQNVFAVESFIDHLASLGGKDPVELRMHLLRGNERILRVVEAAAEKIGMGKSAPEGRGRGVAVHSAKGTFIAHGVEASLVGGRPKVHRVVCAIDCGETINSLLVSSQLECGTTLGLSAAICDPVMVEKSTVTDASVRDHGCLRFDEVPPIEVVFVHRGDPLGGVGELAVPSIAPALANALFALTKRKIDALPIRAG